MPPAAPFFDTDIAIVGAGPAGLALAAAAADTGLDVTLVERQPRAALAAPAPDGREIALTHPSVALLRRLGWWDRLDPHEIGLLREARVHDGSDLDQGLHLDAARTGRDTLGWIVPNHALRRVALAAALARPNVHLLDDAAPVQARTTDAVARLDFDGGVRPPLRARLLVAADSRFSTVRRQLGIGAEMRDFGRTMIVARVHHPLPHGGIAHECFGHAHTLAMLPLPSPGPLHASSAVLTVDTPEAAQLLALPPADYAAFIAGEFQHRLGPLMLQGERHAYPLVATWAHRFATCRAALVGDAAVGMHPVTAHGFNLGLAGVDTLAGLLAQARQRGQDIGGAAVLAAYDHDHQRASRWIYQGTNAVVRLFTDARPLPRLLRQAVLRGADRLPPLKAAITRHLTGSNHTLPMSLHKPAF